MAAAEGCCFFIYVRFVEVKRNSKVSEFSPQPNPEINIYVAFKLMLMSRQEEVFKNLLFYLQHLKMSKYCICLCF